MLGLAPPDATAGNYLKADCSDFINERPYRVTCGFYSMPLNHDDDIAAFTPALSSNNSSKPGNNSLANDSKNTLDEKAGNTPNHSVLIPVMIARATRISNETRAAAVLIPGGGGPGAAIGFGYSYEPGEFLESYHSLRQAGIDVIIVDQRGAGLSMPRLTCEESLIAFESMLGTKRTIEHELQVYELAIVDCRNRLQLEHINVEHFDTRQSALDFLTIMHDLNYQKWFTIATSYATTIAQAMQSIEEAAFERLVLDSPVPLHYQHPITWERTKSAIVESINRCASLSSCSRRYPSLRKKLDAILTSAAAEPYQIKIRVYNEDGDVSIKTIVADDTTLLSIFGTAMYYNEHISELPQVITELHNGFVQALNDFAETFWYQSTDDTYADGLNMTVHCKERQLLEEMYVATRPNYHKNLSRASRLLLQSQQNLCRSWGVAAAPKVIPKLQSNTKTLILAGGLDPVISIEDIDSTASYFSNVSVETMVGAGHSVWYQHQCVRARVLEFLTGVTESLTESSAADCDVEVPGFK